LCPNVTTKIGEALKDKPAAKAGMQKGDVITNINNKPIMRWDQIADGVAASKGNPLTLIVKRDAKAISFTITLNHAFQKTFSARKSTVMPSEWRQPEKLSLNISTLSRPLLKELSRLGK